jgi:hypothetical protein
MHWPEDQEDQEKKPLVFTRKPLSIIYYFFSLSPHVRTSIETDMLSVTARLVWVRTPQSCQSRWTGAMPSVSLDFLGKVEVFAGSRILGVPGKVCLTTGAMRVM